MNRFDNMLARGVEPGKTYGAMPLCYCGRRAVYLMGTFGSQLAHLCEEHGQLAKKARAEGR